MQKLLMIDNAKMMHAVVKARLAQDEIECHSAYNGPEGIALAKKLLPDVILLDIEMPGMDGFEVCRHLKADPDLSVIPVIFLTGVTSTEEKVKGLNLGAVDYITKPFEAPELLARVRASLRTKELVDLLGKRAMIDGLTGLWNRAFFDQRLAAERAAAKRSGHPLACIMADVDGFKAVNDQHGHGFGDLVLRGVARVARSQARVEDYVCRYGGEEFAVLTPGVDAAGAAALAERMRAAIAARQFARDGVALLVTCSFGVADIGNDATTLVERADRALYLAKAGGKDKVVQTECAPAPSPLYSGERVGVRGDSASGALRPTAPHAAPLR